MATQRTFTAEEAQKKFDSLPPEVKDLLYSAEMSAAIQKVGEKNKLHYDQMGRLEMETTNVMLGFTETADYPGILEKVLSVDSNAANSIAKDINDTLFVKIRDAMKRESVPKNGSVSTVFPNNPSEVTTPPMPEKSVVMPSAAKAPVPAVTTPAPAAVPSTPAAASTPSVPEIIKPVGMPMMQHVDTMLSQPTVSIAPKLDTMPTPTVSTSPAPASTAPSSADVKKSDAPAPPPIYKTDPYHEPVD